MSDNPVRWFEIYVDDMNRAKKFYEAVFQITFERLPNPPGIPFEMWKFPSDMSAPGTSGTLVKIEGFPAGNNSVIVYFGCANCAIEEARVEKAGGKIHRGKTPIGEYGFISLIHDSEGNLIGLHSLE